VLSGAKTTSSARASTAEEKGATTSRSSGAAIIPGRIRKLKASGVKELFTPGTSTQESSGSSATNIRAAV